MTFVAIGALRISFDFFLTFSNADQLFIPANVVC